MDLLFLGTGTSTGVPQIGCKCKVCSSKDIRDKRLRSSVLLSDKTNSVLIDCGPDLRQQLLTYNIERIDSVLLTHEHYDHVGGLDDIRPLGSVDLFAERRVLDAIHRAMPYCFGDNRYPGVPQIQLNEIKDTEKFKTGNFIIEPVRVMHANLPILGFRIDNMAYLTDVKSMNDLVFDKLKNLDVLVLNALRKSEHISHLSLYEAIAIAERINAKQVYFTHMSHEIGLDEEISKILPGNMKLAFDGLRVRF